MVAIGTLVRESPYNFDTKLAFAAMRIYNNV